MTLNKKMMFFHPPSLNLWIVFLCLLSSRNLKPAILNPKHVILQTVGLVVLETQIRINVL